MKTIFTILLMSSFYAAFGQIAKGAWSLGPDIDYAYSKTTHQVLGNSEIISSDLRVGATFGYFIADNLEIGISAGIQSHRDEVFDFESTSSGIFVGPNVQYKLTLSEKFYLPIGGGLAYNSVSSEDDDTDEVTFTGLSYGLFAGIEFVENNKVGIHLIIGPEFGTLKDNDTDVEFDVTTFGVGMGFRFYF